MGLSPLPTEANQPQVLLVVLLSAIPLMLFFSSRFRTRFYQNINSYRQKQKLYSLSESSPEDVTTSTPTIQVSSLFIHPIKSLRPVSVQASALTHLGLAGDRTLMVVRPSASTKAFRFLTQRQCPKLATINAFFPLSAGKSNETLVKLSNSDETISVQVNISAHAIQNSKAARYTAVLWDDEVQVVDLGDEASQFLQSIIKDDEDDYADVRLVAQLPSDGRRVDSRYCPNSTVDYLGRVPKVSLTDGFPILIASEESLEELNRRLVEKGKDAIPMSRFRPNIVVKGLTKAFGEDEWKAIKIGEGADAVIMHAVKGCPRCKQSCINQATGERYDEPLETLKEFRALGTNAEDVYFGQNVLLQPNRGEGKEIRVGDVVRVLTKGDPVWDMDTVAAE